VWVSCRFFVGEHPASFGIHVFPPVCCLELPGHARRASGLDDCCGALRPGPGRILADDTWKGSGMTIAYNAGLRTDHAVIRIAWLRPLFRRLIARAGLQVYEARQHCSCDARILASSLIASHTRYCAGPVAQRLHHGRSVCFSVGVSGAGGCSL